MAHFIHVFKILFQILFPPMHATLPIHPATIHWQSMYLTSTTHHKAPHYTSISFHFICLQFTSYPGHSDLKHTQPITISKLSHSKSALYYFMQKIPLCLCHSEISHSSVSQFLKAKPLYQVCKPMTRTDHDLHKLSVHLHNPHHYVFSHTQLTILLMCFIWQLVSASIIGHHQAVVQEHECREKLSTMRQEISTFTVKMYLNCTPNIFSP